jgi:hypothetical protein
VITVSDAYRHADRERLLWSLVVSTIVNAVAWTAVTWQAHPPSFIASKQRAGERLIVSTTAIHLQLQRHARPKVTPVPAITPNPEGPSLSMPSKWSKQDEGREGLRNATLWLDWSNQTAEFVPRVFMWQREVTDPYASRPSLQDAVDDVLGTIHEEGDRLYASEPQRLCGGTRPGWFLAYEKPSEDPPIRVEDTLYVLGDTIYRATYVRPAGQPEDRQAREALNTLCA